MFGDCFSEGPAAFAVVDSQWKIVNARRISSAGEKRPFIGVDLSYIGIVTDLLAAKLKKTRTERGSLIKRVLGAVGSIDGILFCIHHYPGRIHSLFLLSGVTGFVRQGDFCYARFRTTTPSQYENTYGNETTAEVFHQLGSYGIVNNCFANKRLPILPKSLRKATKDMDFTAMIRGADRFRRLERFRQRPKFHTYSFVYWHWYYPRPTDYPHRRCR